MAFCVPGTCGRHWEYSIIGYRMMANQTQSRRCSDGTEIKRVWEHIKEALGCVLGGLGRTHSENWAEARQAKVEGRYAVEAGK